MGELKRRLGAELYAVQVGDGSDDNTHQKSGLISTNKNDILNIGSRVLEPVLDVADKLFIVRGTEAHVGGHAWLEEAIAKDVDAEPDEAAGTWSWWKLPMYVEGVRFLFAHHPPTKGFLPHTRHSAPERCSHIVRNDYNDTGDPVPDVVGFAHVHFYSDSGTGPKPRVWFLPAWQLTTAYLLRLGKASWVPELGAAWWICENGRYKHDYLLARPKRKKAWKKI